MVESSCSAAGHYLRITDHLHFLMARILVIPRRRNRRFHPMLPAIRLLREAFSGGGSRAARSQAYRRAGEPGDFMPSDAVDRIRSARRILSRNAELDPELVEYFCEFSADRQTSIRIDF
jgi:hypothetical protein